MIKLGIIIPTRGDRPRFLANCLAQISRQTFAPTVIRVVDFEPDPDIIDITKRYRIGYDEFRGRGLDLIAFLEDDECYAPNYLEYMVNAWEQAGKPDLFGTNYTHYFHIRIKKYFTMNHVQRASMMNTFIKPDLTFDWCPDTTAYTDMHLWDNLRNLTRELVHPDPAISIGIKHGIGLCGGQGHNNGMDFYDGPRGVDDPEMKLLRQVCDDESFEFFSTYFNVP